MTKLLLSPLLGIALLLGGFGAVIISLAWGGWRVVSKVWLSPCAVLGTCRNSAKRNKATKRSWRNDDQQHCHHDKRSHSGSKQLASLACMDRHYLRYTHLGVWGPTVLNYQIFQPLCSRFVIIICESFIDVVDERSVRRKRGYKEFCVNGYGSGGNFALNSNRANIRSSLLNTQ